MDIVFAEEDRTSPSLIAKKLGINKELENYDFDFAKVISTSPVILGYSFDIEDNNSSKNSPQIPAIFIEKNKNSDTNYLIQAFGTTLNLPILQENSYSSGFLILFQMKVEL